MLEHVAHLGQDLARVDSDRRNLLHQTRLVTPRVDRIRRLFKAESESVDARVTVGYWLTTGGARFAEERTVFHCIRQFVTAGNSVLHPLARSKFWPSWIGSTHLGKITDGHLSESGIVVGDHSAVVQVCWPLEAVRSGHVHRAEDTKRLAGIKGGLTEAASGSDTLVFGGDSVEQFAKLGRVVKAALALLNLCEIALGSHLTGSLVEERFDAASFVAM